MVSIERLLMGQRCEVARTDESGPEVLHEALPCRCWDYPDATATHRVIVPLGADVRERDLLRILNASHKPMRVLTVQMRPDHRQLLVREVR